MAGVESWQLRMTQPKIVAAAVAPAERTTGVVTMMDGTGIHLYALGVPTGVTRPVRTPSCDLLAMCWSGHDGRYAYVLADDRGDEFGHLTAARHQCRGSDLLPAAR
jgi:hypothetical protein